MSFNIQIVWMERKCKKSILNTNLVVYFLMDTVFKDGLIKQMIKN